MSRGGRGAEVGEALLVGQVPARDPAGRGDPAVRSEVPQQDALVGMKRELGTVGTHRDPVDPGPVLDRAAEEDPGRHVNQPKPAVGRPSGEQASVGAVLELLEGLGDTTDGPRGSRVRGSRKWRPPSEVEAATSPAGVMAEFATPERSASSAPVRASRVASSSSAVRTSRG
jgi:hypothetical protein